MFKSNQSAQRPAQTGNRQLPRGGQKAPRALPSCQDAVRPERTIGFPFGEFIAEVELARVVDERKTFAIIVEYTIREILEQDPREYEDENGKVLNNVATVGDRRLTWFDMDNEYDTGLRELNGLLAAFGAEVEELDDARDALLSAENPMRGTLVRIRRTLNIAKGTGNEFGKLFFAAVPLSSSGTPEPPKAA